MFNRKTLKRLVIVETDLFAERHPRSKQIYNDGLQHLLYGVPMNWQQMWPGGYPITVAEARDAEITDVDGNRYTDLCLAYSAALNGHTPEKVIEAVAAQMKKGSIYTLPSENAYRVGEKLADRFGLPVWGYALSATDANRFAIRICREITKRERILVFDGCYHGTVDECFAEVQDGQTITRKGNMGPAVDAGVTTEVISFNDVDALEKALRTEEFACLLMEPVMTNIGIIHPLEGFMDACRKLTKETGTVFIIDEAHTISAGHRGAAGAMGLSPDMLIFGKSLGGGFPVGAYGMTREIAERLYACTDAAYADVSGIGGTMTGSPLAMAAIEATLDHHLTEAAFSKSIAMAKEFTDGVGRVIEKHHLPFCTSRIGSRAEIVFSKVPARNAAESIAKADHDVYEYYFVGLLNRGFIMSPYYNIMASFAPVTKPEAINKYEKAFEELTIKLID